jgi:hypothetical protein
VAATTTQIQIANRALQILGSKAIGSIQELSNGAREINRAYQPVFLNELRQNIWRFAVKRIQLAASATPPLFGPANYYPLPGDYVMLAPPDSTNNYSYSWANGFGTGAPRDWQVENDGQGGLAIITNDKGPINMRYVSSAVTESMFDVSFAEAFSASMAMELCEVLTQSNTKMATAEKLYTDAINQARKRNAFEVQPALAPADPWLLVRL